MWFVALAIAGIALAQNADTAETELERALARHADPAMVCEVNRSRRYSASLADAERCRRLGGRLKPSAVARDKSQGHERYAPIPGPGDQTEGAPEPIDPEVLNPTHNDPVGP